MRDSNPRYPEKGIPDFESSAFGHSANLPFSDAKVAIILETAKLFMTLIVLYAVFFACANDVKRWGARLDTMVKKLGCLSVHSHSGMTMRI